MTITTYSPSEAGVTVGSGSPDCSYGSGEIQLSKVVDLQHIEVGVPTTLTYTVTLQNPSPDPMYLCEINDWLPPDHDFVWGSVTGDIDRDPKEVEWQDEESRYRAQWEKGDWPENSGSYMISVGGGLSKSFSFQVSATVEQGVNYFNEIGAIFADNSGCSNTNTTQGGASGTAKTASLTLYDIAAVAADGTVKARVTVSSLDGAVSILSWQEY